ncbi:MAG TPA: FGGY family carbohydrate kinase [Methanothrix sp.]|nr:FGGY family carbohydrate kinase [Methanothrix sp.]HOK58736.1 FGGY family carbohydrate kinase [Methanothrix sp.]HOL42947.1 FGGY family carbohydrate kinase [Methanothrix sp.]HPO87950.1 FGGY family carbohydrate kinase [Methanothrix sp.]
MYLGIDIGTTSVKAGLFTHEGDLVRGAVNRYRQFRSCESFVEINPDVFWNALCEALRELKPPPEISGISIGGHGPSPVFLDASMEPIAPSILWLDVRAEREASLLSELLGRPVHPAWYVPQTMWLRNHRPEIFTRLRKVLQPMDYVAWKLTGSLTASIASKEMLPWSDEEIDAAGLDPGIFPEQQIMGELIGCTRPDLSRRAGLPGGIPVFAGAPDFVEAILATASFERGIVCDKAGTSEGIELCWDAPIEGFYTAPHPLDGALWHTGASLSTTGLSMEWMASLVSKHPWELAEEAEISPPGSGGLTFLPYLSSERHRISAMGAMVNISLNHGLPEVSRAIMEGCACAMRLVIDRFKEMGAYIKEIRTTGTQSISRLWNQMKADVTGLPVITQRVLEGEMLGAAMIAAYGSGDYHSIREASRCMSHPRERFEPDSMTGDRIFEQFRRSAGGVAYSGRIK